jgi:hypothetical protein
MVADDVLVELIRAVGIVSTIEPKPFTRNEPKEIAFAAAV